MIKVATNKQRLVDGLRNEVLRLQADLHESRATEQAAIENAEAERHAGTLATVRNRELEEQVARLQHEATRQPHRATLDRLNAALREQRQWAVAEHLKATEIRRNQAERIRQLTDPARTASITAAGAAFGFALAQGWPTLWSWL